MHKKSHLELHSFGLKLGSLLRYQRPHRHTQLPRSLDLLATGSEEFGSWLPASPGQRQPWPPGARTSGQGCGWGGGAHAASKNSAETPQFPAQHPSVHHCAPDKSKRLAVIRTMCLHKASSLSRDHSGSRNEGALSAQALALDAPSCLALSHLTPQILVSVP